MGIIYAKKKLEQKHSPQSNQSNTQRTMGPAPRTRAGCGGRAPNNDSSARCPLLISQKTVGRGWCVYRVDGAAELDQSPFAKPFLRLSPPPASEHGTDLLSNVPVDERLPLSLSLRRLRLDVRANQRRKTEDAKSRNACRMSTQKQRVPPCSKKCKTEVSTSPHILKNVTFLGIPPPSPSPLGDAGSKTTFRGRRQPTLVASSGSKRGDHGSGYDVVHER